MQAYTSHNSRRGSSVARRTSSVAGTSIAGSDSLYNRTISNGRFASFERGFFLAVYSMQSENYGRDTIALIGFVVEALQLSAASFNEHHMAFQLSTSWVAYLVSVACRAVSNALGYLGGVGFWVCVGITAIVVATLLFVSFRLQFTATSPTRALQFLRVVVRLLISFFFLPVLKALAAFMYPAHDSEYGPGYAIGGWLTFVMFCLVSIPIALIAVDMQGLTGSTNGRAEAALLCCKVLVIHVTALEDVIGPGMAVGKVVMALAMVYVMLSMLPFNSLWANQLRLASLTAFLWVTICEVASFLILDIEAVADMLVVGLLPAAALGAHLASRRWQAVSWSLPPWRKLQHMLNHPDKFEATLKQRIRLYTPTDLDIAIRHYFAQGTTGHRQGYNREGGAGVRRGWLGALGFAAGDRTNVPSRFADTDDIVEFTDPDSGKVRSVGEALDDAGRIHIAEWLYQRASRSMGENSRFWVSYFNFQHFVSARRQTLRIGKAALARVTTFDLRFTLFRYIFEKRRSQTGSGQGTVKFLDFSKTKRTAEQAHVAARLHMKALWHHLKTSGSPEQFFVLLGQFGAAVDTAVAAYKSLLRKHDYNMGVLRGYGRFLKEVLNREAEAEQYIALAESIEEDEAEQRAALFRERIALSGGKQTNQVQIGESEALAPRSYPGVRTLSVMNLTFLCVSVFSLLGPLLLNGAMTLRVAQQYEVTQAAVRQEGLLLQAGSLLAAQEGHRTGYYARQSPLVELSTITGELRAVHKHLTFCDEGVSADRNADFSKYIASSGIDCDSGLARSPAADVQALTVDLQTLPLRTEDGTVRPASERVNAVYGWVAVDDAIQTVSYRLAQLLEDDNSRFITPRTTAAYFNVCQLKNQDLSYFVDNCLPAGADADTYFQTAPLREINPIEMLMFGPLVARPPVVDGSDVTLYTYATCPFAAPDPTAQLPKSMVVQYHDPVIGNMTTADCEHTFNQLFNYLGDLYNVKSVALAAANATNLMQSNLERADEEYSYSLVVSTVVSLLLFVVAPFYVLRGIRFAYVEVMAGFYILDAVPEHHLAALCSQADDESSTAEVETGEVEEAADLTARNQKKASFRGGIEGLLAAEGKANRRTSSEAGGSANGLQMSALHLPEPEATGLSAELADRDFIQLSASVALNYAEVRPSALLWRLVLKAKGRLRRQRRRRRRQRRNSFFNRFGSTDTTGNQVVAVPTGRPAPRGSNTSANTTNRPFGPPGALMSSMPPPPRPPRRLSPVSARRGSGVSVAGRPMSAMSQLPATARQADSQSTGGGGLIPFMSPSTGSSSSSHNCCCRVLRVLAGERLVYSREPIRYIWEQMMKQAPQEAEFSRIRWRICSAAGVIMLGMTAMAITLPLMYARGNELARQFATMTDYVRTATQLGWEWEVNEAKGFGPIAETRGGVPQPTWINYPTNTIFGLPTWAEQSSPFISSDYIVDLGRQLQETHRCLVYGCDERDLQGVTTSAALSDFFFGERNADNLLATWVTNVRNGYLPFPLIAQETHLTLIRDFPRLFTENYLVWAKEFMVVVSCLIGSVLIAVIVSALVAQRQYVWKYRHNVRYMRLLLLWVPPSAILRIPFAMSWLRGTDWADPEPQETPLSNVEDDVLNI